MCCRGLHELANPAYLSRYLFPGLPRVAPYCAPGGVRVVSGGRATAPRGCTDRLVGIAISVLCRGSRLDCPPRDGGKDHPWPTGDEVYTGSCCLPGARHAACVHFSPLRSLSTAFSIKWTPRA